MARLHVTDHTLIRFLDHAGADTEALRLQLQASLARAHAAARKLSCSDYLIKTGGMVFVVRNDSVTNVHKDDGNVGRRARSLCQRDEDA